MTAGEDDKKSMFTRRRLCVCNGIVLLCLSSTLIYFLLLYSDDSERYSRHIIRNEMFLDLGFPTSKPYFDFVDPESKNFMRMFYSGDLLGKNVSPSASSPQVPVNIFKTKSYNATHCVPFRVPRNRTMKMCIYDPETDRMISSYIRDNGVWEADHVGVMADLMLADDREMRMKESLSSADAKKTEGELQSITTTNRGHKTESRNVIQNPDGVLNENSGPQHTSVSISLVDIGCNIGVYSLSAARLGHEVVAVDPVQDSLVLLATSLHLANLTARVTLLLNAVSDRRGPVDVRVNPENVGGSSVVHKKTKEKKGKQLENVGGSSVVRRVQRDVRESASEKATGASMARLVGKDRQDINRKKVAGSSTTHHASPNQTLKAAASEADAHPVWAVCLDDLVPHVRTRRVFLKLDIEGWEDRALGCASNFFQEVDVRYVMMEWLFQRKSRGGLYIIDFLTRNGFLPYEDIKQGKLLAPEEYYSWSDNVLWGKR